MFSSPLFVLTVLCLSVVASEWLVKRTFLKHLGTALVVIFFVAVLANVGLLPSASEILSEYICTCATLPRKPKGNLDHPQKYEAENAKM